MRTLIALLALLTLTACGAADEAEQRDPRCDYQDDREWELLRASEQADSPCMYRYTPVDCDGAGCPVTCGGFNPDERQQNGGLVDVLAEPHMTIYVECGDGSGKVDRFFCKESAVILIGPDGCSVDSYIVPTAPRDLTQYAVPGTYSTVWKVPAE